MCWNPTHIQASAHAWTNLTHCWGLAWPRGLAVSPDGTAYVSMCWGAGTVARVRLCSPSPQSVRYLQPRGGWGRDRLPVSGTGNLDSLARNPTGTRLFVGHREGMQRHCQRSTATGLCASAPPLFRCNLLEVDVASGMQRCLRADGLPQDHDGLSIYSWILWCWFVHWGLVVVVVVVVMWLVCVW